jgi:hypothetical protein
MNLAYSDAASEQMRQTQPREWGDLERRFGGLNLRPHFNTLGEEKLRSLGARRAQQGAIADFTSYFAIDCPDGVDAEAVARTIRDWGAVETAYVEPGPVPPPVNDSDDPRSANQGYLDAAPGGINARWAWSRGNGAGVGFVDMERGWTLNHEDLAGASIALISGVNQDFASHGTAVLGEVVAVDNAVGDVGVAPGATARVVSQWRTASRYSTAEAILDAIASMSAGDVLLLEAQTSYTGYGNQYLPVEVYQAEFDAIAAATAQGIIVVEAGANGSNDLDAFQDYLGRKVLNRSSADYRDSGAIMVGAASSTAPHSRMSFSNYGSRIDCFAWGQNVDTTGGSGAGTTDYTSTFGGTSSASPIVAGAALLVQSWRMKSGAARYDPATMRSTLSSVSLNTPSANPASDRIGVMPDVKAIIGSYEDMFDTSRWRAIIYILFGVIQDGGGVGWRPGSGPVPIDPWGPYFERLPAEKRDILVSLAVSELAGVIEDAAARTALNKSALGAMQAAMEKLGQRI